MKIGNIFKGAQEKFRRFLTGRYGQDGLTRFITGFALLLCVVSFFVRSPFITVAIFALLIITILRTLSKNFTRRRRENQIFEQAVKPVKRYLKYWFIRIKSRKTHFIYSCKECHSILRLPKTAPGGKLKIKCPKCGATFTRG